MSCIEDLERSLDEERRGVGAASCTLYVQDPYWSDEVRLVSMPGVKVREPMHGWIFNPSSKRLICQGKQVIFVNHAVATTRPRAQPSRPPAGQLSRLFQDFVGREQIQAFARLRKRERDGKIKAILFVNYTKRTTFDSKLKRDIRGMFKRTLAMLVGVDDELRSLDAEHMAESIRILHPAQALAGNIRGANGDDLGLTTKFEKVLMLSLEALHISEREGLGTIHLYEPNTGILRLAAVCGSAPHIKRAKSLNTICGEGIVAWVALMQKALLIDDLAKSQFRKIQIVVNPRTKSVLAVPMIADGELVGVLNLECTREGAFASASVRSIWYAANSAAVACKLATMTSTTRHMWKICEQATRDRDGATRALREIAEVLKDTLAASSCDIWHYNSFHGRFDAAGASYPTLKPALRKQGWTSYVWRAEQPVWLSDLRSESEFAVKYWDGQWKESPPKPNDVLIPVMVNKKVRELRVEAELGLPITVSSECVGVAWIKYTKRSNVPYATMPVQKRMIEAFAVASQAGLVLELVQRQVERADRRQLKAIGERLKPFSASSFLEFEQLPLEGYIEHRPFHAHACGDFHALKKIDDHVFGLLIGDGEGKAVTGLLNAMPLITGFEVFGKGSGSTRHVIDQLRSVSRKLGLAGTALYWTFTSIAGEVWLAMTSAGHEVPLLSRPDRVSTLPEDMQSPALGRPLGFDLDSPQGEHSERLRPGDILVAYTDGVSDAFCCDETDARESPANVGRSKIMSIVAGSRHLSCQELAGAIMSAAEAMNPFYDDATVCVVKCKGATK